MKKRRLILVFVVAVGVVFLVRSVFFSAPDAVSLDSAVEQLESVETDSKSIAADESTNDVDGVWSLDSDAGEFDFETATGSFVGFRIVEELVGVGAAEAVGRTGDIEGELTIADSQLESVEVLVNVDTFRSNDSRRDSHIAEALLPDQFPVATFRLTESIELTDDVLDGEALSTQVEGEFTLLDVTREVQVEIEAQLVESSIVVTGSLPVAFVDYGVEVPGSNAVLSVEDNGLVEFQLFFNRP